MKRLQRLMRKLKKFLWLSPDLQKQVADLQKQVAAVSNRWRLYGIMRLYGIEWGNCCTASWYSRNKPYFEDALNRSLRLSIFSRSDNVMSHYWVLLMLQIAFWRSFVHNDKCTNSAYLIRWTSILTLVPHIRTSHFHVLPADLPSPVFRWYRSEVSMYFYWSSELREYVCSTIYVTQ